MEIFRTDHFVGNFTLCKLKIECFDGIIVCDDEMQKTYLVHTYSPPQISQRGETTSGFINLRKPSGELV